MPSDDPPYRIRRDNEIVYELYSRGFIASLAIEEKRNHPDSIIIIERKRQFLEIMQCDKDHIRLMRAINWEEEEQKSQAPPGPLRVNGVISLMSHIPTGRRNRDGY